MRFIIVTGLSGAGKSEATKSLEDMGYFCVDNLPPTLITKFADVCLQSDGKINKVALVIDIRGGVFFNDLFQSLKELEKQQFKYEILFLDASSEVLLRHKENDNTRSRNFFEHHLKYLLPLKRKWFYGRENVDVLNVDNLNADEVGKKVKEWVDFCMEHY